MPLTILVVDDDFGTRLSLIDYLEIAGYTVVAAANGQEALLLVSEYQPHLIITDISMPQMDGYELVKQVRRRPEFRLVPVIFLTARNSKEERIRGYQLGADNYLPKPFELDELGAIARTLLDRYAFMAPAVHAYAIAQTDESHQVNSAQNIEKNPLYITENSPGQTLPDLHTSLLNKDLLSNSIHNLTLTEREQQVLNLLANGLSNSQIGDRLHLSPRTIEKYVSSLLRKTATNNRAELVRFTMENHLITSEN
ncbi:MAG: response regulator transcription factor [Microcoleaceae cyanobacterium]